jgi:hypothetical protein
MLLMRHFARVLLGIQLDRIPIRVAHGSLQLSICVDRPSFLATTMFQRHVNDRFNIRDDKSGLMDGKVLEIRVIANGDEFQRNPIQVTKLGADAIGIHFPELDVKSLGVKSKHGIHIRDSEGNTGDAGHLGQLPFCRSGLLRSALMRAA